MDSKEPEIKKPEIKNEEIADVLPEEALNQVVGGMSCCNGTHIAKATITVAE
jgi:hypothetical protein